MEGKDIKSSMEVFIWKKIPEVDTLNEIKKLEETQQKLEIIYNLEREEQEIEDNIKKLVELGDKRKLFYFLEHSIERAVTWEISEDILFKNEYILDALKQNNKELIEEINKWIEINKRGLASIEDGSIKEDIDFMEYTKSIWIKSKERLEEVIKDFKIWLEKTIQSRTEILDFLQKI
jgi:hypothetical protein